MYWHIGETTMRLFNVNPRMVNGEKSALAIENVLRVIDRRILVRAFTLSAWASET
jgi:hypothetical protein